MKRHVRLVPGLVVAAVSVASLAVAFAAPGPKDPPPGPPMTEEQVRTALNDKGSITYADGRYRLAVGKVDQLDLIDLEFQKVEGGKVVYKLTSPRARIVGVDAKAGTMRVFFDEMKVINGDTEIEAWNQDLDLPTPRQGKRP